MLIIGIDDTDSERGFCTTYLAAVLIERLRASGYHVCTPKLVRLNPCARYKTRGNAAIAIPVEAEDPESIGQTALDTLLELSDLSGINTNPGLVIAERVTEEMRQFYRRAVTEILEIEEAKGILTAEGIWHRGFKNQRGLIGALAAVGSEFDDSTYELIAYRRRELWGTPRSLDEDSIWEADRATYPATWDTVDYSNRRIVFSPHSPDPVLFGIRGDDPDAIRRAFSMIRSEAPERCVMYVTNQGTDAHIIDMRGRDTCLNDDRSYRLRGSVAGKPRAIEGGHVFFPIDVGGRKIECAAFEPTKCFRKIVRSLIPGDLIEVYGSMKSSTLNLEKIDIISMEKQRRSRPPLCACGRRMESAGAGQGYRCRRCRTRSIEAEVLELSRDIEEGLYEVPPSARRHLAKPLVRMRDPRAHPSR
ncbi:MAG: tRNA(Ile)(2)-agmatinylcytidine synthase [Methanothrix sp.]|nr:tRNA(Ile)(2)-agmatinylcytidine synthase [Methanothrix sp.]MCX8207006.1 tRNA(Ile)(2)-agmatinylcytidine synthase [Methanothrix sp.]